MRSVLFHLLLLPGLCACETVSTAGDSVSGFFQRLNGLDTEAVVAAESADDPPGPSEAPAGADVPHGSIPAETAAIEADEGDRCAQTGDYAAAEQHYARSLAFAPSPRVYNNLGCVLRELSRREEARVCFHQALRLDPGYAKARENLEAQS